MIAKIIVNFGISIILNLIMFKFFHFLLFIFNQPENLKIYNIKNINAFLVYAIFGIIYFIAYSKTVKFLKFLNNPKY